MAYGGRTSAVATRTWRFTAAHNKGYHGVGLKAAEARATLFAGVIDASLGWANYHKMKADYLEKKHQLERRVNIVAAQQGQFIGPAIGMDRLAVVVRYSYTEQGKYGGGVNRVYRGMMILDPEALGLPGNFYKPEALINADRGRPRILPAGAGWVEEYVAYYSAKDLPMWPW